MKITFLRKFGLHLILKLFSGKQCGVSDLRGVVLGINDLSLGEAAKDGNTKMTLKGGIE